MQLSKTDNEIINKFFLELTSVTTKVLTQNLDKEVYKSFKYSDVSASPISNIEEVKENNVLYKLSYVSGASENTLGVLIPEELLSSITDVIMGGSGENCYKGNLSELEINASSDLLKKIFKETEVYFKKHHEHEIAFDAKPKFILKETEEYDDAFNNSTFDFVVKNTLIINDSKEFEIKLLLKYKAIKKILIDLNILQGSDSSRIPDANGINIRRLADVQIEITAELGEARVPIKYALELVRGSIIELDTLNNSDIKVFANGVEVAMAQVVAVEENFGLRITKIISPEERMKYI